jgi:signal transduction histidine kinase
VTANLASAEDAGRRRRDENAGVSTASRDPIDDVTELLGRSGQTARRVLAGPDGPLALALGLALVAMAEVTIYTDDIESAMIANLLATLPLALVRRYLVAAAGAIVFGVLLAVSADDGTLTIAGVLGLVTALYVFASSYRRRWSVLLALPFLVNAIAPFSGEQPSFAGVLLLMLVVAAEALGDSRRQRGEAIAERDETRRAMVDTLQEQAAMEERARIARELHDVVAHHVSAIAVQAETARLTTDGLPDEGREHLESIGRTARDALGEMRRLLGVLREDANTGAERVPQPGLARLDELVDTARAAGTEVRLTLQGRVTPLPPGVDLCAYRILQEALTNARRHAPGALVEMELEYRPAALRLRVRDHGPGLPSDQPDLDGHGLVGMRERAIMVGASLTTGSADGGGFAVEAELPIPVPAP